jgi:polyphenol oxidase
MILHSSALAEHGIKHGFFTRLGGVSTGLYASLNGGLGSQDHVEHVAENRRRMADVMGAADDHFLSLYQVHSRDVAVVEAPWSLTNRPHADSMVTQKRGLALAIATADCGPVLFADPQSGVIGAAHAGWKGALAGVLEATITAMEQLGAVRANIVAAIGPTISQMAYEVDAAFRERFITADAANERFFGGSPQPGHYQFDLPDYIASRLQHAGIGTIEDQKACTYSDETRFFSYRRATHRREKDYGRLISAIMLTD